MTFDNSEEADSTDVETSDVPSEPTVTVDWESDPVPVTTAVEVHDDMLTSAVADRSTVEERTDALQQQVERQQEKIRELYSAVDQLMHLLVKADVFGEGAGIEWDHEP